jgi:hypothetical protein
MQGSKAPLLSAATQRRFDDGVGVRMDPLFGAGRSRLTRDNSLAGS